MYNTISHWEPDCIAFIPDNPDYFLVGTYHLRKQGRNLDNENAAKADHGNFFEDEPEQNRTGNLTLYHLGSSGM
jgi:hypothetical protein